MSMPPAEDPERPAMAIPAVMRLRCATHIRASRSIPAQAEHRCDRSTGAAMGIIGLLVALILVVILLRLIA
jgi:hypothetical protein